MSNRNPRARYQLPSVINPPNTRCYLVHVPDDINHVMAFLGQIRMLASAIAWANDDAHTAKRVAAVWLPIFNNLKSQSCAGLADNPGELEDCMKLRIDPDNSCIVQCFDDCSQTWGTFLDVSQCAPGAVSQPGPGGTPSAGDNNCYDVVLTANNQWRSPIPVKDGDIITISGATGGWSGDVLNWHCPNGNNYLLGSCTSPGSTVGTDPAPSLAHMRLIASFNGTVWQDGYNTTLVVPTGLSATNLLLQANDSNLSDNVGSINFRVCIDTANPLTWVQDFDFLTTSGGWQPRTSHAAWVAGTGWGGGSASTDGGFFIQFPLTRNDFIITSASAVLVTNGTHQSFQNAGIGWNGPTYYIINSTIAENPGGTLSGTGLSENGAGHTFAQIDAVTQVGANTRWTHAHFEGTGHNPFV